MISLMQRLLLLCCVLAGVPALAAAQSPVKLKAGMVTGIDQVGLPIALERGFFEKQGLDVTIARPYATGVDGVYAGSAGCNRVPARDPDGLHPSFVMARLAPRRVPHPGLGNRKPLAVAPTCPASPVHIATRLWTRRCAWRTLSCPQMFTAVTATTGRLIGSAVRDYRKSNYQTPDPREGIHFN